MATFGRERYNLDMRSQEIRAYQRDEVYQFHKDSAMCETQYCRDIYLRDYLEIFKYTTIMIITE